MKVFLSHSTNDRDFVQKLAGELSKEGIEPWLCEIDIGPGDNFVAEIEQGLKESDLALLVFSPDAARSAWTKVEWTSVLASEISESRTRLGVLYLKDCELPELLRTKIYVDARANQDKGLREAVAWLKQMRDMQRAAQTRAASSFLPYDPQDFVGRAAYMERLFAALAAEQGIFLLHGEPGSGKSTLALKFAWKAQGAFDVVVFQPCGQRAVEEIAPELATRLGLDVKTLAPEQQIAASKDWLRARRSFLVLDDVWNADVEALIPGPPVSVLFTSRQRSLAWVPASRAREVKSFSPEEAESVFRIFLGEEEAARHRAALLEFAKTVDILPIAVAVGADVLRREFDPVDEAARGLRLTKLRNAVHDVPSLLRRAFESQPDSSRKLLQAMAVCAPEGFWLPLAAEIAGLTAEESRESRDRLRNSSLLRMLDRERQRFQLHALLREQVRGAAPLADLQQRHASALEGLFRDWEKRWKDCIECLPEVGPAVQFLWEREEADRMEWLGSSAYRVGRRVGELEAALRILKQEEDFWTGREDRRAKGALLRIHGNQAVILQAWGRMEEAMALLKKVEAFCLELGNKDDLQRSYGNQALILKAWGRLDEAMALHKKEEALCVELGDKDGLQASYGNQALILKAWRKLEEAMALHKKEEALCLELGNKDSLQRSYGNQAVILQDWGRLEEAITLLKKQEGLCLKLGNRSGLAYCYWNWGLVARQQGEIEVAREKLRSALAIFTDLKMPRERDKIQSALDKL